MLLPHPFRRFLANIRPDRRQLEALQRAHLDLSRRLRQDADTRGILVSTFLQGSYRRSTAIRGSGSSGASDVDLVMVTNIDPRAHGPERALRLLEPFLRRNYANWRPQGRSSGITVGGAELDLVLASAPSRVDLLAAEAGAEPLDACGSPTPAELLAWKSEPLLIPDRKLRRWVPTHPLAQLARTRDKNARCNTHYLGVVKAIKWWRSCNAEIAGAAGGLLIGALLKDSRRWMTLGAVFGGIYGAIRGHSQVREGWRVRSWYEGEQVVCVEVLGLPIGRLK